MSSHMKVVATVAEMPLSDNVLNDPSRNDVEPRPRGRDEIVWALSEKDGREIWAVRIAPAQPQNWPQSKEGSSATPTVDGDRVYVMGLAGNVACLQAVDGRVIWQRSLVADFKGRSPMWSFHESPLVDGDKVICTPGGEEATMVALSPLA